MYFLSDNRLLPRDLFLSFVKARAQYEHLQQQEVLHLKNCLLSVTSFRPAALPVQVLYNDCHL